MSDFFDLNPEGLSQVENMSESEKPLSHDDEVFLTQTLQNGSMSMSLDMNLISDLQWNSQPQSQDSLNSIPVIQNPLVYTTFGNCEPYQIVGGSGCPIKGEAGVLELPLSQSSTASHDDGILSIEGWEGPYNFSFSLEQGTTRKFNFSTRGNKLFCLPSHEIEFFFSYDFEKCVEADMNLVGFLRYTKSDAAAIPVKRCISHEMEDKTKLQAINVESEAVLNETVHVLKCMSKKAAYLQDKTNRCSVKVPMGRPHPGSSSISKLFKFDCLSSCKRTNLPKKCPITCVFELHKKHKVVGRVSFNLRVCSCPARDFLKEETKAEGSFVANKGEPKKRRSEEANAKSKTIATKRSAGNAGAGDDLYILNDEEKPTKKLRVNEVPVGSAIIQPNVIVTADDPFVNSSQESQLSDDDGVHSIPEDIRGKYRDMVKCAKYLLKLSYSPDSFKKYIGKSFAREIRKNCRTLQEYTTENQIGVFQQTEGGEGAPNGSPDSGVNDNE